MQIIIMDKTIIKDRLKKILLKINLLDEAVVIAAIKDILLLPANRGWRTKMLKDYFFYKNRLKPERSMICKLFNGKKIYLYKNTDSATGLLRKRILNFHEIMFLRSFLTKDDYILDVGANSGSRTLMLSDIIKGGILFEPNKSCVKAIMDNLQLNALKNFEVIPKALGDHLGKVKFSKNLDDKFSCQNCIIDEDNEYAKQHIQELKTYSRIKFIDSELATIDYELRKRPDINPVTFIKIDVEGFELEVLKGAIQTIKERDCKIIMFEKWRQSPLKPYLDLFNKIGWIIFGFTKHGVPTENIKRLNTDDLLAAPKNEWGKIQEYKGSRIYATKTT